MRKLFGTATAIALVIVLASKRGGEDQVEAPSRSSLSPIHLYLRRRPSADRHPAPQLARSGAGSAGRHLHPIFDGCAAYSEVDPVGTYQAGTFMLDTLHPAMGASAEHGFYGY